MSNDEFKALGRGLSTLINERASNNLNFDENPDLIKILDIKDIIVNKEQPRKIFSEDAILQLSKSIKTHGILQPILVEQLENNKFKIIAGERRWRAAQLADLKTLPAIIKKCTHSIKLELSLIENIQRENLKPLEEANIYKELITNFDYTQEKVAEKIGKSRSYITNYIRLLSLPAELQKLLSEEELSVGHAKLLLTCDDPKKFAEMILKDKLSVRETEKIIAENKTNDKILNIKHKDPDVIKLERKIYKILNLKTKVKVGKNSGSITVNFTNMDEFDRLVGVLCTKLKLEI
ncbi:MAG: ParB family chromosome partitioning protein [Candidatus Midichloriaceae bacterium]|jgi:ParB family chromosome partitioning protein